MKNPTEVEMLMALLQPGRRADLDRIASHGPNFPDDYDQALIQSVFHTILALIVSGRIQEIINEDLAAESKEGK